MRVDKDGRDLTGCEGLFDDETDIEIPESLKDAKAVFDEMEWIIRNLGNTETDSVQKCEYCNGIGRYSKDCQYGDGIMALEWDCSFCKGTGVDSDE